MQLTYAGIGPRASLQVNTSPGLEISLTCHPKYEIMAHMNKTLIHYIVKYSNNR